MLQDVNYCWLQQPAYGSSAAAHVTNARTYSGDNMLLIVGFSMGQAA
jgi:hypothetical protein